MQNVATENNVYFQPYGENYIPFSRKYDIEQTIEFSSLLLSMIGPLLLLLYFDQIEHIFFHYNLLSDSYSIDVFSMLYKLEIVAISKILFASSIFSGIGVLLSGIHENRVVAVYSLCCFLISVGYYVPTLMVYSAS